jgi:hypothetical protein
VMRDELERVGTLMEFQSDVEFLELSATLKK